MRAPLDNKYAWGFPEPVTLQGSPIRWKCGFCGESAASGKGYYPLTNGGNDSSAAFKHSIRVCGNCQRPTYFEKHRPNTPSARIGEDVKHLPEDVTGLFDEMRDATGSGAYTASVLAARKLLMHVAVEKGAGANQPFITYVEYLVANHYAPAGSEAWVDYIRTQGNEANHEIKIMTEQDAQAIINLTTQLLRNVYELPASVPGAEPKVDVVATSEAVEEESEADAE